MVLLEQTKNNFITLKDRVEYENMSVNNFTLSKELYKTLLSTPDSDMTPLMKQFKQQAEQ